MPSLNIRRHVLLTYLALLIALVTLLPFRFQWPEQPQLVLFMGAFDIIANFGLFLPLGFLYRLQQPRRGDRWCRRPACFGLLMSIAIEGIQLFMPGRFSSPIDVLGNSAGVWVGAMLHDQIRQRLPYRQGNQLTLEMPLLNLFYLLLPLLWLNSLSLGHDTSRLWLLPLLGLCGTIVLAAVWARRLQSITTRQPLALLAVTALWFALGTLPAVVTHPHFLILCGVGLLLVGRLLLALPWSAHDHERRFEVLVLRRLWPVYLAYLIMLILAPWPWMPHAWRLSVGFADLADMPGIVPTLRIVVHIAAFTLFGYMTAESRGRQREPLLRTLRALLIYSFVVGGGLEVLRGFHPHHVASMAHGVLIIAASLYGGAMYRLQLLSVQRLLRRLQPPATALRAHKPESPP